MNVSQESLEETKEHFVDEIMKRVRVAIVWPGFYKEGDEGEWDAVVDSDYHTTAAKISSSASRSLKETSDRYEKEDFEKIIKQINELRKLARDIISELDIPTLHKYRFQKPDFKIPDRLLEMIAGQIETKHKKKCIVEVYNIYWLP